MDVQIYNTPQGGLSADRARQGADVLLWPYRLVLDADRVLGLGLEGAIHDGQRLPDEVAALIHKRQDGATADALREAIRPHGYEIEDTPADTRWKPSA